MTHHRDTVRSDRHLFYAFPGRFPSTLLLLTSLAACDTTSRPDDTLGVQTLARWEWHARLAVEPDHTLTQVSLHVDTTQGGGEVGLARKEFHPLPAKSVVYDISLGHDTVTLHTIRQALMY